MIHIRHPLRPLGGNSFYRDKSVRESATLCGAPCDYFDVLLRDTRYKNFNTADPFYVSKGGFCPSCLEIARSKP